MNYYEHHLGDYAAATSHLSLIEDAVYSRMIRRYYLQEAPLPAEVAQVARFCGAKSPEELAAVEAVLNEFFIPGPDGWHQSRCDEEIAKFRAKQDKAKASASVRWANNSPLECERNANAMRTHSERIANAMPTQCEGNALQTPDTRHQKEQKRKGGKPPALTLPDWLPPDVWEDWHAFRNGRKGWTAKARTLSLQTLTRLRSEGHEPRSVVEQSIERGWTGLFPVRVGDARAGPASATHGKTMGAILALEEMKRGLAQAGNSDGSAALALPGT